MQQTDAAACLVRLFGVQRHETIAELDFSLRVTGATKFGDLQGPPDPPFVDCEGLDPEGERRSRVRGPLTEPASTIVAGYVLASVRAFANQPISPLAAPPPASSPLTVTTCPLVKLRVSAQQSWGPVWIDCDRRIEIPSPHACVGVTAPATWLLDPSPTLEVPLLVGDLVWDVWIKIKICRAFCCSPLSPILTEQFTCSADVPTDTIRPRAARRLSIESSTAAALDFEMFWGDPGAGGVMVGTLRRTIGNGGLDLGALPSFTHVRAPAVPGGTTRVIYAWEVLP